ncbi:MAG: hypothetical protein Q8P49_02585 [Candidatus Liptonbacteria bacterium]|nr:hypothetical protein [Candidatus Liptonbacteria bacterium]
MGAFNQFVRMLLIAALGFCLLGLATIAYFQIGPFLVPRGEYFEGNLVGVVSGERIDGHWALVGYRFVPEKGTEEVSCPVRGQDRVKFYARPTNQGVVEIFAVEEWHKNQIRMSMAASDKALKLDAGIQRKAMSLLQIGRKRFAAIGGVPPVQAVR